MSSSYQEPSAPGKPAAVFSFGSEEPGDQFKSSVFKNADPSNVGRSLLEGKTDNLLDQAKSELMRQEHQVGSLNNCISELQQNMHMLKDWNYKTHNTDTLNLDKNKFGYKNNYLWRKRFSEILKYARTGRNEESSRTTSWRSLSAKIERKSWDDTEASSPRNFRKCRKTWILWMIRDNFKKWNQTAVGDCRTFPVSLQWFQVLVPCSAATVPKRAFGRASFWTHDGCRAGFWWRSVTERERSFPPPSSPSPRSQDSVNQQKGEHYCVLRDGSVSKKVATRWVVGRVARPASGVLLGVCELACLLVCRFPRGFDLFVWCPGCGAGLMDWHCQSILDWHCQSTNLPGLPGWPSTRWTFPAYGLGGQDLVLTTAPAWSMMDWGCALQECWWVPQATVPVTGRRPRTGFQVASTSRAARALENSTWRTSHGWPTLEHSRALGSSGSGVSFRRSHASRAARDLGSSLNRRSHGCLAPKNTRGRRSSRWGARFLWTNVLASVGGWRRKTLWSHT